MILYSVFHDKNVLFFVSLHTFISLILFYNLKPHLYIIIN